MLFFRGVSFFQNTDHIKFLKCKKYIPIKLIFIFNCICRVTNSCSLYLLFVIEQTADKKRIRDVNFTPALAQLYFSKVAFHVGGDIDFPTFQRRNPDWENLIRDFPLEKLLYFLKEGNYMELPELVRVKRAVSMLIS